MLVWCLIPFWWEEGDYPGRKGGAGVREREKALPYLNVVENFSLAHYIET